MRPQPGDYAPYYEHYINLVPGNSLSEALAITEPPMFAYLDSIPNDKGEYAYASGKWTIKQLLQHVIDAERIFTYRALCFARGDKTPLPGFDEDDYAREGTATHRTVAEMVGEYKLSRAATKALFESFTPEDLTRAGLGSNNRMTVLAAGYVIVGHALHHVNVLKERYLIQSIA